MGRLWRWNVARVAVHVTSTISKTLLTDFSLAFLRLGAIDIAEEEGEVGSDVEFVGVEEGIPARGSTLPVSTSRSASKPLILSYSSLEAFKQCLNVL